MHGCNYHEKRCKVCDTMHEKNLHVMALSKTKLESRGEEKFGRFKGIKAEVTERMYVCQKRCSYCLET